MTVALINEADAGTSRCLGDLPGTDGDPIASGASPGWPLSLPVDIEDINGIRG